MATLTATRPKPLAPSLTMRAPGRKGPSFLARMTRVVLRRPRRSIMVGLGLALASAIILNALVFQKARHPAPFLSAPRLSEGRALATATQEQRGTAAAAGAAAQAILPPARPANLEALIRETASVRPAANVGAGGSTAPRSPVREAAPRDPIADLIMNGDARPPAEVGVSDAKRTVLATQKALAKLGYGPAESEGRLDESTRAALERFEKDRKLPVTRELSPRTLRELASASGLRIE